ncbi:putative Iron-sulfur flavoprotein [uncultured delta proteobacterium]|uniref:Putative Iron-sulfur flavoprotein n=1 Tax=uncultured delta proteobacterium TaxID=34034 RepID=A0A212K0P1_9DELT|nr:putative Iron-sulfur flavoprotein [uncultured delta proteobacterium]
MTSRNGPLLLACSPRSGGNSDTAISVVQSLMDGADSSAPSVTFLRNHPVLPCVSCGHCARHKLACPLAARDESAPLFDALQSASALVLAAPVYFYHVPAQLKALIDRSQPWWMLRDAWKETPFPRRTAHIILIAARPQGQKLFEGSLLSLRYWLDLFGYDLAEPLTLHGLEGPDALRENTEQYARLVRYAETIKASLPRAKE